jgi:hypothetical protein
MKWAKPNRKGETMKAADIKQGGRYTAKISGRIVTVRVDAIRSRDYYLSGMRTVYDVTNLSTGRRTTFRSAARFRRSWEWRYADTAPVEAHVRNENEYEVEIGDLVFMDRDAGGVYTLPASQVKQ